MWFVFPQFLLGHSDMARRYAIRGRAEAMAYTPHPTLGPRLRCVFDAAAMQLVERGVDPDILFGGRADCLKCVSSATLSRLAATEAKDAALMRLTESALASMGARGYARCARTEELWCA